MKSNKKRGLIGTVGALAAATALALSGTVAASADPVEQMPEASDVIIHKLEQNSESTLGDHADGLPIGDTSSYGAPLGGVTFTAYKVTLYTDNTHATELAPGTNAWQEAVAGLDITSLPDTAVVSAMSYSSATTAVGTGIATLNDVPRGVYVVRETGTPAGIIPAAPFLLTVPLTHPINLDEWLEEIHIYPKNSSEKAEKTVENAEAYVVGDTVTWSIDLPNPSKTLDLDGETYLASDKFVVLDTIKDEFLTAVQNGIMVTTPTDLDLGADDDYYVVLASGDEGHYVYGSTTEKVAAGYTQIQIIFTDAGLSKLAEAKNGDPEADEPVEGIDNVVIEIPTVVNKLGVISNSASYYDSLSNTEPKDVPPTDVRYGAITLQKDSTDNEVTDFSGAEFRVYLSEDAAKEANESNGWGGAYSVINTNGYLVPADGPNDGETPAVATGIYKTNSTGTVIIGGLRYSGYADGESFGDGDDRYQTYWLLETKALADHQLLGEPVPFIITESSGTLPVEVITNSKDGGFELPLTGGTGTLLLTILGVGILATVIVVARRRQNASATE